MKNNANRGGLGHSLWTLRKATGLTLREAAKATGVDYAYLSRVETGTATPRDSWVGIYAAALGDHILKAAA